jgi:hypothetical protein
MTGVVYLIEITAYDPGVPGVVTLRYGSEGFSDPAGPGFFDGRLIVAPTLTRTTFAGGTTFGPIEVGFGEIRLANADGGLDDLVDYGFDGRQLRVLIGETGDVYADFVELLVGTIQQPTFTHEEVAFRIRDRLFELDTDIQTTLYAGTNSGATGQEGLADDIKGKPKPLSYGQVDNVTPVPVNTTQLIYQYHTGSGATASAIYEGGGTITKGSDYTSLADMTTTAPSAGQARDWPGGGMFRLGSSPTLPITCDVVEGASAADRTAAQILERIVTGPGGIDAGDVVAGDVTALDSATAAVVGVYISEPRTVLDVLTEVANAVGAWVGFDRQGQFRMRRFAAPSGTPVATLRILDRNAVADSTTLDIIDVQRVATEDEGRGVPAYRYSLRYGRNWTQQRNGEMATTGISQARRAFLAEDWRTAVDTDASVQTAHLKAIELEADSLIVAEAAAATEAARRLDLYSVRRDRLVIRTFLSPAMAEVVDLGAVVSVEMPRYGYDAGRLMTVIGISLGQDPAGRPDIVDLDLWG